MLTLTQPAVEAVTAMARASGNPDTSGLRIARSAGVEETPDAAGLEAEFVTDPSDEDEVVIQDGARLFLEPNAAAYLTDKVLDGQVDEEGHVHFALGQQATDGDQPQP